jgi:hypothetical protein
MVPMAAARTVLLHRHKVVHLLRQLAAQHRAAARLHAIRLVPRLAYWAQISALERVKAA